MIADWLNFEDLKFKFKINVDQYTSNNFVN